ncbi:ANTAR domain-containing protein [Streptomyces sp. NPDC005548]|uniref:ANTAR domain-containing protein n=1 Tax=Streptomyces sp. NPDC005548 TaxID=3364724 RepID=UPI0036BCD0A9
MPSSTKPSASSSPPVASPPDQGWNVLRRISQRTNIKLRHVSELIIEWARTGNLTADIRTELEQQLAPHARNRAPVPEAGCAPVTGGHPTPGTGVAG